MSWLRGHLLGALKMNQLAVYTWAQIQREGLLLCYDGNLAQEGVGSVGTLADKNQRRQQREKYNNFKRISVVMV